MTTNKTYKISDFFNLLERLKTKPEPSRNTPLIKKVHKELLTNEGFLYDNLEEYAQPFDIKGLYQPFNYIVILVDLLRVTNPQYYNKLKDNTYTNNNIQPIIDILLYQFTQLDTPQKFNTNLPYLVTLTNKTFPKTLTQKKDPEFRKYLDQLLNITEVEILLNDYTNITKLQPITNPYKTTQSRIRTSPTLIPTVQSIINELNNIYVSLLNTTYSNTTVMRKLLYLHHYMVHIYSSNMKQWYLFQALNETETPSYIKITDIIKKLPSTFNLDVFIENFFPELSTRLYPIKLNTSAYNNIATVYSKSDIEITDSRVRYIDYALYHTAVTLKINKKLEPTQSNIEYAHNLYNTYRTTNRISYRLAANHFTVDPIIKQIIDKQNPDKTQPTLSEDDLSLSLTINMNTNDSKLSELTNIIESTYDDTEVMADDTEVMTDDTKAMTDDTKAMTDDTDVTTDTEDTTDDTEDTTDDTEVMSDDTEVMSDDTEDTTDDTEDTTDDTEVMTDTDDTINKKPIADILKDINNEPMDKQLKELDEKPVSNQPSITTENTLEPIYLLVDDKTDNIIAALYNNQYSSTVKGFYTITQQVIVLPDTLVANIDQVVLRKTPYSVQYINTSKVNIDDHTLLHKRMITNIILDKLTTLEAYAEFVTNFAINKELLSQQDIEIGLNVIHMYNNTL